MILGINDDRKSTITCFNINNYIIEPTTSSPKSFDVERLNKEKTYKAGGFSPPFSFVCAFLAHLYYNIYE